MNLEKYQKIKKKCESLKSEAQRALGARDQLLKKLEDEYACKNTKQAEKLLKELEEKKDNAEVVYEEELQVFEEKWESKLSIH